MMKLHQNEENGIKIVANDVVDNFKHNRYKKFGVFKNLGRLIEVACLHTNE